MAISSITKTMQQVVDHRKRQAFTKIREVLEYDHKVYMSLKVIVKKAAV